MKTVTFTAAIQVDVENERQIKEVVEIINLELQRTSLNSSPQILSESVKIISIEPSELDEI